MKILFLTNRPLAKSQAGTVIDYLDSFAKYSEHEIFEIPMLNIFPSKLKLENFDIVIVHYTLSIGNLIEHYLGKELISLLKNFKGLKVAFIQDEYRYISTIINNIKFIGLDLLFSCVPNYEIEKVYPKKVLPHLKIVNILTGYLPENLVNYVNILPIKDRKIDIGYRARKMPFSLGKLGYEKYFISEEFARRLGKNSNFNFDLSTNEGDRLYGREWIKFLISCKTVLGVESGASILDYDGSIEQQVNKIVKNNPKINFEDIFNKYLYKFEGNLNLNQISPRCFEAIKLKTPMILFEGKYSNILEPNRHYIELKKDFSNFDDVLDKIKNLNYLNNIAETAYQEIGSDPTLSYKSFIKKVDFYINQQFKKRKLSKQNLEYNYERFNNDLKLSFKYIYTRRISTVLQSIFLGKKSFRKILFRIWFFLPVKVQNYIRPITKIISR